jgi:hypothetical protein
MATSITQTTPINPYPDSLRCIHRMIPQWCAVCNPPPGPRRKSIGGKGRYTGNSGRGVFDLKIDPRPMFARKVDFKI